jgi:hypothetical protein
VPEYDRQNYTESTARYLLITLAEEVRVTTELAMICGARCQKSPIALSCDVHVVLGALTSAVSLVTAARKAGAASAGAGAGGVDEHKGCVGAEDGGDDEPMPVAGTGTGSGGVAARARITVPVGA